MISLLIIGALAVVCGWLGWKWYLAERVITYLGDNFQIKFDAASARCAELAKERDAIKEGLIRESAAMGRAADERDANIIKCVNLESQTETLKTERDSLADQLKCSQANENAFRLKCNELTGEAENWRRERDFFLTLSKIYLADVRVEARKRSKLWLFARSLVRQKDEMQRVIIGLQGEVAASGEVSQILLDGEAEKQARKP